MVLVWVNRVFVVVAAAAALGSPAVVDAGGQSVGDVVDLALEAVGGRAALASVADLRVSGSAELDYGLGPVEGVFELVIEPGRRARQLFRGADGSAVDTAWTGSAAWAAVDLGTGPMVSDFGPGEPGGAVARFLTFVHPLFPGSGVESPAMRVVDRAYLVDGVPHIAVRVDVGASPFTVLVGRASGLVSEVRYREVVEGVGDVAAAVSFSDWRRVGGVLWPGVRTLVVDRVMFLELRAAPDGIRVGGGVESSLFDRPDGRD